MMRRNYRASVASFPIGIRYLAVGAASLLTFLIVSVIMIFAPSTQMAVLRVVLPILVFLLGALWALLRLPWYLGWALPAVLFTLLAFLRLEGVYSLSLLIGYVPLALAGSLAMYCLLVYLKRNHALAYEAEEDAEPPLKEDAADSDSSREGGA